jgi:hypothetical protein
MKHQRLELNLTYLKHILAYNELTGIFTWKVSKSSKTVVGSIAGTLHPNGYIYIGIDGYGYRAHRLAWFYVYGKWPADQIDHINFIKTDNSINNLRDVDLITNIRHKPHPLMREALGLNHKIVKGKYVRKTGKVKFNQENFIASLIS